MITNERQYKITKTQLKKFDQGLAAQAKRERDPGVDPRIHGAMGAALKSQADELRHEVRDYEKLRAGRIKGRKLDSLRELPRALIEARIAAHVTQKGLADRIGVAEQQVQRWEATSYAGVNFERFQDVLDALGAEITKKVSFPAASKNRAGEAKVRAATSKRSSAKSTSARGSSSARASSAGKKRSSRRTARSGKAAARRA